MTGQRAFRAALLDARMPVPDGLLDAEKQPAGRRFDVYRNNVVVSLVEALKTAFPLVQRLIGEQNFDTLATLYVRAHPPLSPLMMFYGAEFPAFLEGFEPLSHIGYLPDAARLDLAMRASYHAADTPPFDPNGLQKLSGDALMDAKVTLAPSTIFLPSRWPLFDIWAFNTVENAPKPKAVAQDVLVTRPEFDPSPRAMPAGALTWFEALKMGQSFGEALLTAQETTPAFDLTASLTLALETQAFQKITHKDLT